MIRSASIAPLLALLLSLAPAAAQEAGDDVALEASLVEVPVVVTDRKGRFVPGLAREAFALSEDGEPQEIVFFGAKRTPMHVALLLDASASTDESIRRIQAAAVAFVDRLLPDDRVMVVSFANEVQLLADFTSDREALERAIRHTRSRGNTKLYDAVALTISERLRHVEGRKAVVLLSDGNDSGSGRGSEKRAILGAAESNVVVYGIRYPPSTGSLYRTELPKPGWQADNPADPTRATAPRVPTNRFMERIAEATGGRVFYTDENFVVATILSRIGEELDNAYVLGYAPTRPLARGGERKIEVRVPSQKDLGIRHRPSYRASH